MEPSLVAELGALTKLNHRRIAHVLGSDSPRRYDLTKALVDVLYNLCVVQSIDAEEDQRKVFEDAEDVIRQLLSKKVSLAAKKNLLQENVRLVVALAETCLLNV